MCNKDADLAYCTKLKFVRISTTSILQQLKAISLKSQTIL